MEGNLITNLFLKKEKKTLIFISFPIFLKIVSELNKILFIITGND